MHLKNKIAVITGASRGLGRSLAKRYASEGAAVCLCARNNDLLRSVSLEILATGGRSYFEQVDIADGNQVNEFIENSYKNFGEFHVLVNNASLVGLRVPISEYPIPEWNKIIAVNLTGSFLVTQAALRYFSPAGGSIINVSSSVGRAGRALWGAYSISKFGIEGFTQLLSEELRSRHIRVNAVNPGALSTEMRKRAYPDENQSQLKKPEDILDVFLYLASDASAHVTGKSFDAQQFKGSLP